MAEGAPKERIHCDKFVVKDGEVQVPWPNGDMPCPQVSPAELADMQSTVIAAKPSSIEATFVYEKDGWSSVIVGRRMKDTCFMVQLIDNDNNKKQICQVLVHHFAPPKTEDFTDAHRENACTIAKQLAYDLANGTVTVDDVTHEKNSRVQAWRDANGLGKKSASSGGATVISKATSAEPVPPTTPPATKKATQSEAARSQDGKSGKKRAMAIDANAEVPAKKPKLAKHVHWRDPVVETAPQKGSIAPAAEEAAEEEGVGEERAAAKQGGGVDDDADDGLAGGDPETQGDLCAAHGGAGPLNVVPEESLRDGEVEEEEEEEEEEDDDDDNAPGHEPPCRPVAERGNGGTTATATARGNATQASNNNAGMDFFADDCSWGPSFFDI